MVQSAKVVDITRSYVPVVPSAFPITGHDTAYEDRPENLANVVPFDGYNFLPTAYGYKSYFGINKDLAGGELTSRVDHVFLVQNMIYQTYVIALCEDGIWRHNGTTWVHDVSLAIPEEGTHYNWTYCHIESKVYCYRANGPYIYVLDLTAEKEVIDLTWHAPVAVSSITSVNAGTSAPAASYTFYIQPVYQDGSQVPISGAYAVASTQATDIYFTVPTITGVVAYNIFWTSSAAPAALKELRNLHGFITYEDATKFTLIVHLASGVASTETVIPPVLIESKTPTFLNMAGQQGIFAAGMRLGFWDNLNSVAWSSIDDMLEFTPSIETLAGSSIFSDVTGNIVQCLSHKDGFIIYATKSIVGVHRVESSTFLWEADVLQNDGGIAFQREVCAASPNTIHYAHTATAFIKIEDWKLEVIIPEVFDTLKDMQSPVYLDLLQGRYLFVESLEAGYLTGFTDYHITELPDTVIPLTDLTTEVNAFITNPSVDKFFPVVDGVAEGSYTQDWADDTRASSGMPSPGSKPPGKPQLYTPVWRMTRPNIEASVASWTNGTEFPAGVDVIPVPNLQNFSDVITHDDIRSPDWALGDGPRMLQIANSLLPILCQRMDSYVNEVASRSDAGDEYNITNSATTQYNLLDVVGGPFYPLGSTQNSLELKNVGSYPTNWAGPFIEMDWCHIFVYMLPMSLVTVKGALANNSTVTVTENYPAWWRTGSGEPTTPDVTFANIASACSHFYPGSVPATGTYVPTEGLGQDVACYIAGNPVGMVRSNGYRYEKRRKATQYKAANHITDTVNLPQFGWKLGISFNLIGWEYTDANGITRFVDKPTSNTTCTMGLNGGSTPSPSTTSSLPPDPDTSPRIRVDWPTTDVPTWVDPIPPLWPATDVVIPGGSFVLQDGSIGPLYPTIYEALVYDTHLKKWGRLKQPYSRLVNLAPLNHTTVPVVDFATFGIEGGLLTKQGSLRAFDQFPAASKITYGKFSSYRLGFTALEEVRLNFKEPCSGRLTASGSLDGRNLNLLSTASLAYNDVNEVLATFNLSARWYDLSLEGLFDLSHFEVRTYRSGRR